MTLPIRLLLAMALSAVTGFGLWYLYHSGYQAGANSIQVQWDRDRIDAANAQQKALGEYVRKLQKAEAQHDKDRNIIDDLYDELGRLRVHLPAAGDARARQNLPGRAFSAGVDEGFARLQGRAAELFRQCDRLNIDAVSANTQ